MTNFGDKELKITIASLEDAFSLQKALTDAIRDGGLDIDIGGLLSKLDELSKIDTKDIGNIGWAFDIILSISTDKNLRTCLLKCAERSLLGLDKVNKEFFEKEENRQYYFPVMIEIARANLAPFFPVLNSWLKTFQTIKENFLKQK